MIFIIIVAGLVAMWQSRNTSNIVVTNFEECVNAGNSIMESYPRTCKSGEETFTENIGNVLEKQDLIRITSPQPNDTIQSPLLIKGEARGVWFFEASFPILLTDGDGTIVAEGFATAKGEWMTKEFVPFEATLTFTNPQNMKSSGSLILKKDNPSGLPEHDDNLQIPVWFESNIKN